jgi:hypothetical protein
MNSKKIGPNCVLAEDLQQQALPLARRAIEQDAALAEFAAPARRAPGRRLSIRSK